MPLWFLRQITEQIGAKLPKTGFPSIKMSRFLRKKRDKTYIKCQICLIFGILYKFLI